MPERFGDMIANACQLQTKFNLRCKRSDHIATEEDAEIYATHIVPPTRLISDRVFIDAKYIYRNPDKREYYVIVSSNGNEGFRDHYLATNQVTDTTVGYCYMSVHYFAPAFNER
jgi:hypothetical protein